MREFRDKVAVVTGAGHGVGRALANECANEGMRVVVADIEGDPAELVAASIRERGGQAIAVETDVAERAQVEALADRTYEEFGAAHLLFNNAGVSMHKKIEESSVLDWNWLLEVNLWGPLNGIHAFLPRMRAQGGEAHIVNTASMSGLIARRNQRGIYQAVKHGVVALTIALRNELEDDDGEISASVFCPGGMVTDIEDAGRHRQERFGGPFTSGRTPCRASRTPSTRRTSRRACWRRFGRTSATSSATRTRARTWRRTTPTSLMASTRRRASPSGSGRAPCATSSTERARPAA